MLAGLVAYSQSSFGDPRRAGRCSLTVEHAYRSERICMKGFRTFLLRGNLVDLAVAVVIGVAFNNIVQSLVKDIITPLIAAAGGAPNFGSLKFTIGSTPISYGLFVNAVITFLIVAAVVYFLLVAPTAKLLAFIQRNKEASERECPECLSLIPAKATRCKFCTAVIQPPAPAAVSAPGR
jgi:large conductance mechanosensitive channel